MRNMQLQNRIEIISFKSVNFDINITKNPYLQNPYIPTRTAQQVTRPQVLLSVSPAPETPYRSRKSGKMSWQ